MLCFLHCSVAGQSLVKSLPDAAASTEMKMDLFVNEQWLLLLWSVKIKTFWLFKAQWDLGVRVRNSTGAREWVGKRLQGVGQPQCGQHLGQNKLGDMLRVTSRWCYNLLGPLNCCWFNTFPLCCHREQELAPKLSQPLRQWKAFCVCDLWT